MTSDLYLAENEDTTIFFFKYLCFNRFFSKIPRYIDE